MDRVTGPPGLVVRVLGRRITDTRISEMENPVPATRINPVPVLPATRYPVPYPKLHTAYSTGCSTRQPTATNHQHQHMGRKTDPEPQINKLHIVQITRSKSFVRKTIDCIQLPQTSTVKKRLPISMARQHSFLLHMNNHIPIDRSVGRRKTFSSRVLVAAEPHTITIKSYPTRSPIASPIQTAVLPASIPLSTAT